MKIRLFLLLISLLVLPVLAFGQNIEIRVSVKVISDPVTGVFPADITEDLFRPNALGTNSNAQDSANAWMASYWRGYRFRITEVVPIGGPGELGSNGTTCIYGPNLGAIGNGPSCWFGIANLSDDPAFNIAISANPTLFKLRSDQVNFYVSVGRASEAGAGGACPIPPGGSDTTWCHAFVNDGPWWLVHEAGHFFGLHHTFAGGGILGTLPDGQDWTRDQIFNNARDTNYMGFNSLPFATQERLVDDTYFNVMSYHEAGSKNTVENHMTELQLDRHADTANGSRAPFVSGKTRFVSLSGSDSGAGSSTSPFKTISRAVTSANAAGGDIILMRPGAYNQTLIINKPCTLRATRDGPASIGTSTP